MVADSPNAHLPPLTPQQAGLLHAFLVAESDIFAPVRSGQASLSELISWFNDPAVQAHLEEVRRLSAAALEIRAAQAARTAITALERIATTDPSPIEQRRAASTILRALGRAQQHDPSLRHAPGSESHHRRRSIRDRDDAEVSDDGSRADALDADESLTDNDDDIAPDPQSSPEDVANLVAQFLKYQDSEDDLRAFFDYFAPDATIDGNPVPTELPQFLDEAPVFPLPTIGFHQLADKKITHDRASFAVVLFHDPATAASIFALQLIRATEGPHQGCWLIKALSQKPDPAKPPGSESKAHADTG